MGERSAVTGERELYCYNRWMCVTMNTRGRQCHPPPSPSLHGRHTTVSGEVRKAADVSYCSLLSTWVDTSSTEAVCIVERLGLRTTRTIITSSQCVYDSVLPTLRRHIIHRTSRLTTHCVQPVDQSFDPFCSSPPRRHSLLRCVRVRSPRLSVSSTILRLTVIRPATLLPRKQVI